jgi:hypothetical protein
MQTIKSVEINYDIKIINSNNNIIVSNLTNILTIINLNDNIVSYFIEENPYNCFYGSELYIYESSLFVSCSLYYPFNNIPDILKSQIFIYNVEYNNNNVKNIVLTQIINTHNNDIYFGTNINANNNILLVSGQNKVYYYTKNNEWELTNNYDIQDSYVNFDYKVKLIDDYFIIGNYGFSDLQGAVFSSYVIKPPSNPTNTDNISDLTTNKNNLINQILVIIFVFIVGSVGIITISLSCYFFVSLITPKIDEKKKKKDEEENSPYKVYSYMGYVETDDNVYYNNQYYNDQYNNNQYNNNQYYYPYYFQQNVQFPLSPMEKGKLNESDNEKVVSYKGYIYDSIQEKYKEKIKPILDEINKNKE